MNQWLTQNISVAIVAYILMIMRLGAYTLIRAKKNAPKLRKKPNITEDLFKRNMRTQVIWNNLQPHFVSRKSPRNMLSSNTASGLEFGARLAKILLISSESKMYEMIAHVDCCRCSVSFTSNWFRTARAERIAAAPNPQPSNEPIINVDIICDGKSVQSSTCRNHHMRSIRCLIRGYTHKEKYLHRDIWGHNNAC